MHKFDDSANRGEIGVKQMVEFFSRVMPFRRWEAATHEDDLVGIDGYLIYDEKDDIKSVQIKFDEKSADTGNAFVEHFSQAGYVDRPAWFACPCGNVYDPLIEVSDVGNIYICVADLFYQYFPGHNLVIEAKPNDIRRFLRRRVRGHYPLKPVINRGYTTFGFPVPIRTFMECCQRAWVYTTGKRVK